MDLVQEQFGDRENLEEASSLSRMIQALNPKLLNKKGKESFYAFKYVFKDIFVSLIMEFLCNFLGVESLAEDCTPETIKNIKSEEERQIAFSNLICSFIIETHSDFENCPKTAAVKKLPLHYPHQDFVRRECRR